MQGNKFYAKYKDLFQNTINQKSKETIYSPVYTNSLRKKYQSLNKYQQKFINKNDNILKKKFAYNNQDQLKNIFKKMTYENQQKNNVRTKNQGLIQKEFVKVILPQLKRHDEQIYQRLQKYKTEPKIDILNKIFPKYVNPLKYPQKFRISRHDNHDNKIMNKQQIQYTNFRSNQTSNEKNNKKQHNQFILNYSTIQNPEDITVRNQRSYISQYQRQFSNQKQKDKNAKYKVKLNRQHLKTQQLSDQSQKKRVKWSQKPQKKLSPVVFRNVSQRTVNSLCFQQCSNPYQFTSKRLTDIKQFNNYYSHNLINDYKQAIIRRIQAKQHVESRRNKLRMILSKQD